MYRVVRGENTGDRRAVSMNHFCQGILCGSFGSPEDSTPVRIFGVTDAWKYID
jgi:hypothetical protein